MNLQRIGFNGKELVAVEQNGKIYVAMKPIVTNLGLDWEGQRQRIHRNEVLSSVTFIIKVTAEDGKEYDTLCLPLEYLNGWLFGVDVSRVSAEIKPLIIQYQKECYNVLYSHFHKPQKEMTQIDILVQSVLKLQEQERQLLSLQEEQNKQSQKLLEIESKITTKDTTYYTISGYANLNKIKVDKSVALKLGKQCSSVSNNRKIHIGKEYDAKYGLVNTYSIDILKEVFDNYFNS